MRCTYTSAWDTPITNQQLNAFNGVAKSSHYRGEIIKALTQDVRSAGKGITLPYIRNGATGYPYIEAYALADVVADYVAEPNPMAALMAVIEHSDCPHVAAYRLALAQRYAADWANKLEEFKQ